MRNYSLNPTEENAYKLLRENPIQRNEYVFQFVRLLTHMEDNCYSVALNGDWGSGKTFFVKQVKLILDAHNPQFHMKDETRREIQTLYKADEKPNSYATVYYDAWTYDNHDDPILSLVYAASQSGQKADLSDSPSHVLEAAAAVFDAFTGKNLTSLVKGLGKVEIKDRLSEIRDTEELKSKIHEFIDTLTAEKANQLVFFIDELDRCKPDYAIRFLERIKHYFDDERILCGEKRSFSHERQKETEEKVECAINRIALDDGSVTDLEATKNILGTLFPGIKTNMGWSYGVGRGYSRRDSLIRNSIAAPECFDRYFALTLENGAIPTATVRRMVFESSESELAEEIMQIYRDGKIVRLLEAIEVYAGAGNGRSIDAERASIIIKVLSCNWSSFEVEDEGFFAVPFAWRLLCCVDPLLKSMDSKARASLMCSIFENENVQVSTVALLLQDFENQLGRCAENARESADAVLPLDEVQKLEAIFKERAVKAIDSKVVLRQYHGLRFLWLLGQIDPETAADKKKSMVTDDVSLVKIIDECTSRGSVAMRIVAKTRTVDRDRLSEFVDLGEAYRRVKKFATKNQFFDLPQDEQMSAIAFILIVERGPVESSLKDCIAEDAIIRVLDQMKSKIEIEDTQRD